MSGIFGLSAYNDQNLAGLIPDKTRESFREYGYFGGGNAPGNVSTVDRIDYSNDTATASVRGPLDIIKRNVEATGNSNFGYFGGSLPLRSTVDRIDYSNDTATASVRGPLSQEKYSSSASGNSNFGWFTGGHTNDNIIDINFSISTIDRIDYSNDLSTASIRGNLNQNRTNHSIAGNSNYGWIAGGNLAVNDSPFFTSVERLDYSNDVSLTSFRSTSNDISGQGNSATGNNNFGYYHRANFPAGTNRTDLQRIDYSNDLISPTLRGNLTLLITGRAASGNSNFGYFSGGSLVPAGYEPNSSVERIDYSNDTTIASVRGPLSSARSSLAATSSHSFGGSPISQYGVFPKPFGYFGNNANFSRFDFSNDTSASVSRTSISGVVLVAKATGNSNYAWIGGGLFSVSSKVYRFDYSNDNAGGVQRGPLSAARGSFAATGNYNFGYFSGGIDPGVPPKYSIVDRIDYSNDNVTALRRGSLSAVNYNHTGVSNLSYAYFIGGGDGPTTKTWVERINYSNDNASTSYRSPLQNSRRLLASSGNSNFAYVSGGDVGGVVNSIVERIDYASDTSATSIRGPLSLARAGFAGTGNSNFGYFGGGGAPGLVSTVDRIDYSNDTATATARTTNTFSDVVDYGISPLTPSSAFSPDQLIRGTSNTDFQPTSTFFDIQSMRRIEDTTNESVKKRVLGSYGYFGGGLSPDVSTVERIDYSNDNSSGLIRGPLSGIKRQPTGVGNNNFGYIVAGGISSPSFVSLIERIDYSNDSVNTSIRGNIDRSVVSAFSVGNEKYGYIAGGFLYNSRVQRIDYSNDNSTPTIKGSLNKLTAGAGAAGNNNFGYFGGGGDASIYTSIVERINYSNDSIKPSIRGPLSLARSRLGATGNNNFGYFGGGRSSVDTSIIERIDYSNDTVLASVRSNLVLPSYAVSSTGNSNFGYFIGFPFFSTHRLDYNNDTNNTILRGALSAVRYRAATTNARNS